MRRLILCTIGLLVMSIPGWAQESYPKAEVFGGFSLSSMASGSPSVRNSFYGWQASLNRNLQRRLGIVGDFGAQYKTVAGVGISNYQYLFGPQISLRQEKVTPFVHALFGANRTSALGLSSTNLALGMGGGLDLNVSDRLSLRVPQFDWTPIHGTGAWTTNIVRVGFGLVIKVGE
jgi:hypothetical protein